MYKAHHSRTILEVEMSKKCTPLWREARSEVKTYKAHQVRNTFASWHVPKVHAVVVRSTFPSQNVKKHTCSDHFWKFRCGFAWQAQGILHLATSEQNVRVLSQYQRQQLLHYTTLHATTLQLQLHYITLHPTPLHYTQLHYTILHYHYHYHCHCHCHYNYNYNCTTLHYTNDTTLDYTPLHYTTVHSMTLHYNYNYNCNHNSNSNSNCTTLHYIILHYITLHYVTLHYIIVHYITRHDTTWHDTHSTPLHSTNSNSNYNYNCNYNCICTTLHYITLHSATLHSTTLHSSPVHSTTLRCTNYNYSYNYTYATLHHTRLDYTTWHYPTLHTLHSIHHHKMQLQLHYTNYTTPQIQLHYATATNTAALHHTTSSSCGWGGRPGGHCNHCSHSKEHSSNHLSVHQWIRSATRDSQQPSSPIGFLFWNFRHRLVRYYWKHISLHPNLSYNSDNIFGYNFSPSAWHDPYVRNTTARIWTGSRGPGWIGSVPLPPAIACHGVQGFPQTGHGWQLGGERLVAVTWNMGPGSLSIPKSRNPKHVERQLFEKFGYVSKILKN